MNDEILLTDLFDVDMLQQIQDAFAAMTGCAAQITDANGKPVTRGSNYTAFCRHTRNSPIGCMRCEQCDRNGADLALRSGTSITYFCHAGLMDFAAPIMAGDKLIGCFVGGQVLTAPPDITRIMQASAEMGVELMNYLQSVFDVPMLERSKLEDYAKFLYTLTNILSTISYHRYKMHQANIEIEKVANMKSDFLANMSHEIRTPMNAVIGMAEMALREDLTPAARDYITQIKASGKTLLTIINDILDFSKVESGKMDIIEEEYEPMSVINDVSSIISTRVGAGDVEFILDLNPNIPRRVVGDNVRIKQVIINIANNAVKFTKEGQVKLTFDYKELDDESIEFLFSVEDTGIGIKPEDMKNLFQSFKQLDSKRNRSIEGTGLGLAISKQLMELMNGKISVRSTYGEGSIFSIRLPQKVVDDKPSIALKEEEDIHTYGYIQNRYVARQLQEDIRRLGLSYTEAESVDWLIENIGGGGNSTYIFVEKNILTPKLFLFVQNHPEITLVVLTDPNTEVSYELPNVITAKKPLSTLFLAAIFNEETNVFEDRDSSDDYYDFVAPDAQVLIVDDNPINLTVAEGLLEPLSLKIDKALSGPEAVEMIGAKKYDLILMDHMMPEVDGVETTHLIRRFHKDYDNVPIIALTANAVSGVKEMFIKEGMNDFIAKPIEVRMLAATMKRWLPKEKIKVMSSKNRPADKAGKQEESIPAIPDLDIMAALKLAGSVKLFWAILKDYYRAIPKKRELIKKHFEEKEWRNYTVEVHALKSASRQVGATELADLAAQLEAAGNAQDIALIAERTPELLERYAHYEEVLKPHFPEESERDKSKKPLISSAVLSAQFETLEMAIEDLDMDIMEEVKNTLSSYRYEGENQALFERICEAIDDIDPDECESILEEWKTLLDA
ncbi:MAG: PocR ligand-binding domain-containing protein [Roseburia sp.]|nr:PocR ligand-binding domain-containing protein [Roseburia sp.]